MSVLLIICLVIAVIFITAYLVSKAKSERKPEEAKKRNYAAAAIVFRESIACPSVMQLADRRFLCSDAPTLPLVDCTKEVCTCAYHHYDDRRGRARRVDDRSDIIIRKPYEGIEKRTERRDRRAEEAFDDATEQAFDTHTNTYYDFMDKTSS